MNPPTSESRDLQAVPKETDRPDSTTPPPAYTPGRQSSLSSLSQLQQAAANQSQERGVPIIIGRSAMTTVVDLDEDDAEPEEGISPICLRINTSIMVTKSNNMICLSDSPASHANAIAKAVVQAIQENSSGNCGIPMIDEDGRPRPVRIEVDAGITVEGSGNIIANEEIIKQELSNRRAKRALEEEEEEDESAAAAPKRPRSGSFRGQFS